mmetsp:Transcript_112162/g.362150  ORF Transcript_112162/g.362150 Transcript_112162/m.362150 type:complete len:302 (-) Transcript_112162:48-953(-)
MTRASSETLLSRASQRRFWTLALSKPACSALASISPTNSFVARTCASSSALPACTSTTLLVSLPTSPTMTERCWRSLAMLSSAAVTSSSSSPILSCEATTNFWSRASSSSLASSLTSTSLLCASITAANSATRTCSSADSTTIFVSLPTSAVINMRCLRRSAFSSSRVAKLFSKILRPSRMATMRACKSTFDVSAAAAIATSSSFSASRVLACSKSSAFLPCSTSTSAILGQAGIGHRTWHSWSRWHRLWQARMGSNSWHFSSKNAHGRGHCLWHSWSEPHPMWHFLTSAIAPCHFWPGRW